jgi:beta-galactosidase beta subunit
MAIISLPSSKANAPLAEQRPEYHRQYIDIHIVWWEEIIGAGNKG